MPLSPLLWTFYSITLLLFLSACQAPEPSIAPVQNICEEHNISDTRCRCLEDSDCEPPHDRCEVSLGYQGKTPSSVCRMSAEAACGIRNRSSVRIPTKDWDLLEAKPLSFRCEKLKKIMGVRNHYREVFYDVELQESSFTFVITDHELVNSHSSGGWRVEDCSGPLCEDLVLEGKYYVGHKGTPYERRCYGNYSEKYLLYKVGKGAQPVDKTHWKYNSVFISPKYEEEWRSYYVSRTEPSNYTC